MRRLLFICLVAALPVGVMLAHVAGIGSAKGENRALAPFPQMPGTLADAAHLPGKIDAYLSDHFGLRSQLIAVNGFFRWRLFGEIPHPQITVGRNGRIFLGSHSRETPNGMLLSLCGVGIDEQKRRTIASDLADSFADVLTGWPRAAWLIVPSAPTLYPEDRPNWLVTTCAGATPLLPDMIARLPSALQARILYPLPLMRESATLIFPKANFHWAGEGAKVVVEPAVERLFSRSRVVDVPSAQARIAPDLAGFMPGVRLRSHISAPDYARTGIRICDGSMCFPAARDALAVLGDVRVVSRGESGPRLLILSDSFGSAAAGYFGEYYREVWQVSLNDFRRLSDSQRAAFRAEVLDRFKSDDVLFLYHDGGWNNLAGAARFVSGRPKPGAD